MRTKAEIEADIAKCVEKVTQAEKEIQDEMKRIDFKIEWE